MSEQSKTITFIDTRLPYEVSDLGRIRKKTNEGYVDVAAPAGTMGYRRCSFYLKDGKREWWLLHRLVWRAFVGPIADDEFVIAIDGDYENCALSNFGLATREDSDAHRSNASANPRLLEAKAAKVKRMLAVAPKTDAGNLKNGVIDEIHRETGVSRPTILNIRAGRAWRWLEVTDV